MALAMAPAAQVYVFGGEWNSFNEALTAMAAHGEISQFSISYEGLVIYDQGVSALAQMASNNQTIYVASGDNGAYLSNIIGDLRSSADVTVVGGTALSMDGTGIISVGIYLVRKRGWYDSRPSTGLPDSGRRH